MQYYRPNIRPARHRAIPKPKGLKPIGIKKHTIENELSEAKKEGPVPEAVIRNGNRENNRFSYSEIRAFLLSRPKWAKFEDRLPENFLDMKNKYL